MCRRILGAAVRLDFDDAPRATVRSHQHLVEQLGRHRARVATEERARQQRAAGADRGGYGWGWHDRPRRR
jgi:hypothetical protein